MSASPERSTMPKRPAYRPGLTTCPECRALVEWDQVQFADQRDPKRKYRCDDCAQRRTERMAR